MTSYTLEGREITLYSSKEGIFHIHVDFKDKSSNSVSFSMMMFYEHFDLKSPRVLIPSRFTLGIFCFTKNLKLTSEEIPMDYLICELSARNLLKELKVQALKVSKNANEVNIYFNETEFRDMLIEHQQLLFTKVLKLPMPEESLVWQRKFWEKF